MVGTFTADGSDGSDVAGGEGAAGGGRVGGGGVGVDSLEVGVSELPLGGGDEFREDHGSKLRKRLADLDRSWCRPGGSGSRLVGF